MSKKISKELMCRFIAGLIKARLEFLYDIEKTEGTSAYLQGRKDGTLVLLRDIVDVLAENKIVKAGKFLKQAIPV